MTETCRVALYDSLSGTLAATEATCEGMKRHIDNCPGGAFSCNPVIAFGCGRYTGPVVFHITACDDENMEPLIYCPFCGRKLEVANDNP